MKCRSCGAEIPPAFVHSIATNQCAGCGGQLMNDEDKSLLDELTDAMQRMPNDAQGVAGWLMSNYRFNKIGDAKPVEKFHRKSNEQVMESTGNLKIAPNPADEYLKRTDSYNQVQNTTAKVKNITARNDKIAALANAVRSANEDDDTYGVGPGTVPEEDDTSSEDIQAYQQLVQSGIDPFKGAMASASAAGGLINPNAKPLSSEELRSVYKIASGGDSDPDEAVLSTTDEGRRELMRRRLAKLKAQDVGSGGGGGFFRR